MKIKMGLTGIVVMALAVGLEAAPSVTTSTPARTLLGNRRPANAPAAPASRAEASASEETKEAHALNFNQAPLELVFDAIQAERKRTVLKDPGCPSPTITLKTREGQKLSQEDYLEAIYVILEMNGVHLEDYGEKFIRALPRAKARKEGIPLIMDSEQVLNESGKVVSMMIPFKNIAYDEAQKVLDNFKSDSGILLALERTNSILVTDTEQNINRMLEIAKTIDVATPVTEDVFVRQIQYASAADIKTSLEAIVQESQREMEKNGKQPQNTQNQPRTFGQPRVLGRNQPPPQPQPNSSLVLAVSDADRGMIRGKVLILADERSNKLIIVTSQANMNFFDKVIKQLDIETTPDTVVKVYRLKYADAEEVSDMINDLIGNAASSKSSTKSNQNQNARNGSGGNITRSTAAQTTAKKPSNQRTGEAKAGELSKDNTTVLADKRINGLVVMTNKELVPVVEKIIESMDVKLSQVLIETVIVEVSLGDDIETGVDWVMRGKDRVATQENVLDSYGRKTFYYNDPDGKMTHYTGADPTKVLTDRDGNETILTLSETPVMQTILKTVRDGFVNNGNYMLGGGGGSEAGTKALNAVVSEGWKGANPIGGGVNYFLKSDKLNLAAVIKASKTDSRTKYIASPVVMTVDNKEATINATKMKYLLKGFQSSGNSYSTIAVPDYEQKELGIEIKVTPKINPNGTVMLSVEEKYSQISGNQDIKYATGNSRTDSALSRAVDEAGNLLAGDTESSSALETVNVPTTATREMSADVILENMQTVIFGGLTETLESESEKGIPILKDIPWIGKWLFSSVVKSESRSELLIFMTPYVLEDAEAAQAEAIRRKKTLSDPRPWDDHGWSLSELADPVSKKEQIRRLKDEWKKQDEERKTKIAIEQEKVKRVKRLKELSAEERKVWLKMHEEELEEEEREELEKQMLDPESQEELRKLAEQVRIKKLGEAEEELKAADEAATAENERGKLEAEKARADADGESK